MATFQSHTIRVDDACTLWRDYGSRVAATDRVGDLIAKFTDLPAWKCRVLITISRQVKEAQGSLETVFGDCWRNAVPVENRSVDVIVDGDEKTVSSQPVDGINHPIMNLSDLIHYSGTDIATHEVTSHKVNSWSTVTKGDNGEPKVTRLWQVTATFKPRVMPLVTADWGPPPPYKHMPIAQGSVRRAVVLPDMQIGFRWVGLSDGNPWAEPYHDRKAISIGLQLLASEQPEYVVLLGDNLDFQPLSLRWPAPPNAMQTTSIALLEYRWLLWRIRQICPSSKIVYMYGNHEDRLRKYLDERAGELQELSLAGGIKALSLRNILGLDDLHIDTVDYPQPYWLWDRVEIEHGRTVRRGGGATAATVAAQREHSVLYGHIHRQELAHRTVDTPQGKREFVFGSPGCLCRTDGIVPGVDRPDWQQGLGVLSLVDDQNEHLDLIRIRDGKAFYGSRCYVGHDYVADMVSATGAKALLPR